MSPEEDTYGDIVIMMSPQYRKILERADIASQEMARGAEFCVDRDL